MQGDAYDLGVLLACAWNFKLEHDPAPKKSLGRAVLACWELIPAFVAADRAFRAEHDLSTTPGSRRRVSHVDLAIQHCFHC